MAKDNKVTITQSIETGPAADYDKKLEELEKYADKKGLAKPGKGELLSWILRKHINDVTPEEYYKI